MGSVIWIKIVYPSTKDECEEGVEFVTKVNDILDALLGQGIELAVCGVQVYEKVTFGIKTPSSS